MNRAESICARVLRLFAVAMVVGCSEAPEVRAPVVVDAEATPDPRPAVEARTRAPSDSLPDLKKPTLPKICKRPSKSTAIASFYRDSMGYSVPDNALIADADITLKKGESFSVGADRCVYFENVRIAGGDIGVGGKATVSLVNVRISGSRSALSVGGSANVTVEGGSFEAPEAIHVGGDAVVSVSSSEVSGHTAVSLGGGANLTMARSKVRCEEPSAFDECVSVGGSAVAVLDHVVGSAVGRVLSVGGGGFVTVDGGSFSSKEPSIGAAAFDAMGGGVLVMLDVKLRGTSSVSEGGGGKVFIRGGDFDPPLTRNGKRP